VRAIARVTVRAVGGGHGAPMHAGNSPTGTRTLLYENSAKQRTQTDPIMAH
jgi:hypothetical protein